MPSQEGSQYCGIGNDRQCFNSRSNTQSVYHAAEHQTNLGHYRGDHRSLQYASPRNAVISPSDDELYEPEDSSDHYFSPKRHRSPSNEDNFANKRHQSRNIFNNIQPSRSMELNDREMFLGDAPKYAPTQGHNASRSNAVLDQHSQRFNAPTKFLNGTAPGTYKYRPRITHPQDSRLAPDDPLYYEDERPSMQRYRTPDQTYSPSESYHRRQIPDTQIMTPERGRSSGRREMFHRDFETSPNKVYSTPQNQLGRSQAKTPIQSTAERLAPEQYSVDEDLEEENFPMETEAKSFRPPGESSLAIRFEQSQYQNIKSPVKVRGSIVVQRGPSQPRSIPHTPDRSNRGDIAVAPQTPDRPTRSMGIAPKTPNRPGRSISIASETANHQTTSVAEGLQTSSRMPVGESFTEPDDEGTPMTFFPPRKDFRAVVNNNSTNISNVLPRQSINFNGRSQARQGNHSSPLRNVSSASDNPPECIDLITPETNKDTTRKFSTHTAQKPTLLQPIKMKGMPSKTAKKPNANGQEDYELRQRNAAERIISKEAEIERTETENELFGGPIPETEEEKKAKAAAAKLKADQERMLKELKIREEIALKKQIQATQEKEKQEKEAAEKAAKEKEEKAKAAERAEERKRHALIEEALQKERRQKADEKIKARAEEAAAAAKLKEEQKQRAIADKMNEARVARLEADMRNAVKTIAALQAAQLTGAKAPVGSSPIGSLHSPGIGVDPDDIDIDDSLFVAEDIPLTKSDKSKTKQRGMGGNIDESSDSDMGSDLTDNEIVYDVDYRKRAKIKSRGPANATELFAAKPPERQGQEDVDRDLKRQERLKKQQAIRRERAKSPNPEPTVKKTGEGKGKEEKPKTEKVPKKPRAPSKPKPKPKSDDPGRNLFSGFVLGKPMTIDEAFSLHPKTTQAPVAENPTSSETAIQKLVENQSSASKPPSPIFESTAQQTATRKLETKIISTDESEKLLAEAKAREEEAKQKKKDEAKARRKKADDDKARDREKKRFMELAQKHGVTIGEAKLKQRLDTFMANREIQMQKRREREAKKADDSFSADNLFIQSMSLSEGHASTSSEGQVSSPRIIEQSSIRPRTESQLDVQSSLQMIKESRGSAFSEAASRTKVAVLDDLASESESEHSKDGKDSDESEEDPDDPYTEKLLATQREAALAQGPSESTPFPQVPKVAKETEEVSNQPINASECAKASPNTFASTQPSDAAANECAKVSPTIAQSILNPDEFDAQIVEPLPNMSSSFEKPSQPTPNVTETQLETPEILALPLQTSTEAPYPPAYKEVNVYSVIKQNSNAEAQLVKQFLGRDKANAHARNEVHTIKAQIKTPSSLQEDYEDELYRGVITYNENVSTTIEVTAETKLPEEISDYDANEVIPIFRSKVWMIKYKTTKSITNEKTGAETEEICTEWHGNKFYPHLEMANSEACKFAINFIKPKEPKIEHFKKYAEWTKLLRGVLENADATNASFGAEIERDENNLPWFKYQSLEVSVVEMNLPDGPPN